MERAWPLVLEHPVRVVSDSELDERRQDGYNVVPLRREAVEDLPSVRRVRDAVDDPVALQLPEPHRQDARRQAIVVPEDPAERHVLEERDVSEDKESPLPPEDAEARGDRAVLERDLREDRLDVLRTRSARHRDHRYTFVPWMAQILYKVYRFRASSPRGTDEGAGRCNRTAQEGRRGCGR